MRIIRADQIPRSKRRGVSMSAEMGSFVQGLRRTRHYANGGKLPSAPEDWWSKEKIAEAVKRCAVDDVPPTASEWSAPPIEDAEGWCDEMRREQREVPDDELQRRLYHPDHVSRPVTAVVVAQFQD